MGAGEGVKVVESCMVTPSEETPRKGLWLSPLDLMLVNNGHTPTVYLYRSDCGTVNDFFDVARLKVAMAKALVAFYPLAGRLGVDADGRPEIDCAGQGALFTVARSDLTVDDISHFMPSPELKSLFVPRVEDYTPSLMCGIQVNFLKCGGVALGTALHHAAIDAVSAFHFFQTWSAFSRDGEAAAAALQLPCHDRTLLRARSPPVVHPDALTLIYPKKSLSEPSVAGVNEIFVFSKDQVAALKRACSTGGNGDGAVSTFCAVSAHVWRCLCAARELPLDATTRLTFPANVRRSLRPKLPESYFGNGIIVLAAGGKVRDVIASEDDQPLASVAGRISGAIRRMDDEMVRSAIDYFEMAAGSQQAAKPRGSMPKTDVRVISWLGMPLYDADFGWGKPLVMHRAVQQRAGFVYLMDGAGGGVRILVSMELEILSDLQRLLYANF